jgi:hypothetical protein
MATYVLKPIQQLVSHSFSFLPYVRGSDTLAMTINSPPSSRYFDAATPAEEEGSRYVRVLAARIFVACLLKEPLVGIFIEQRQDVLTIGASGDLRV